MKGYQNSSKILNPCDFLDVAIYRESQKEVLINNPSKHQLMGFFQTVYSKLFGIYQELYLSTSMKDRYDQMKLRTYRLSSTEKHKTSKSHLSSLNSSGISNNCYNSFIKKTNKNLYKHINNINCKNLKNLFELSYKNEYRELWGNTTDQIIKKQKSPLSIQTMKPNSRKSNYDQIYKLKSGSLNIDENHTNIFHTNTQEIFRNKKINPTKLLQLKNYYFEKNDISVNKSPVTDYPHINEKSEIFPNLSAKNTQINVCSFKPNKRKTTKPSKVIYIQDEIFKKE